MGAFYGSVQVRTSDVGAVVAMARRVGVRCLVGPAVRGWVGVYPEMNGQDVAIADRLGKGLEVDAFWLMVHDSDVFAYRFYRGGKMVDEFDSCPEYFEKGRGRGGELRGRPEVYGDLLPAGVTVEEVRAVLEEASEHVMAEEGLEAFCELLGIPNALAAYEYLIDGETDLVEGWEEFVEVPEASVAMAMAKEAARAEEVSKATAGLRQAGKLLGQFVGGMGKTFPLHPVWCAEKGEGGGFLVAWGTAEEGVTQLERVRGPGWGKAERVGIELDRQVNSLAVSGSGRYVAVGHSGEVWELEGVRRIARAAIPGPVGRVGFAGDEFLLAAQANEVVVAEVATGRVVASLAVAGGRHVLAVHPSGKWGIADAMTGLVVFELPSGRLHRNLCVGGSADTAALTAKALVRSIEWARKSGDAAMVAAFEEKLAALGGIVAATAAVRRSAERLNAAVFDATGRWLAVGTDRGPRVYEWEGVLAETEVMPAPVAMSGTEMVAVGSGMAMVGITLGVAFDDARGEVLYCGVEGKVSALPLSGGQPRTVIDVPGELWLTGVGVAGGGSVVGCAGRSADLKRAARTPGVFQVWTC